MRLPPATATASYALPIADLAAQEPPELDLELLAAPELPADLGRLTGPLTARIHLELKGPHLLMHAEATGDLALVCSRCVQDFPYHLALRVDEHMVVQADEPTDEELEWDMASVAETVAPDGALDLVDWLRQHLILDMPAKQLCAADCAPPQAAGDTAAEGDPRWGALRRLTPSQGDDHGTT